MDFFEIILFYLLYFGFNSLFVDYIDKKTSFNESNNWLGYFDSKFRLLFMFIGLPCLLFKKRIKKLRKNYYYKKRLEHLKQIKKMMFRFNDKQDEFDKEILKLERYLALEKIKKNNLKFYI